MEVVPAELFQAAAQASRIQEAVPVELFQAVAQASRVQEAVPVELFQAAAQASRVQEAVPVELFQAVGMVSPQAEQRALPAAEMQVEVVLVVALPVENQRGASSYS